MIKRLTVFLIFVVHVTVAAMQTDRCLKCLENFDDYTKKKIQLVCSEATRLLLKKHPNSQQLRKEYYCHSMCLACVRHVFTEQVFCPTCSEHREVTLDEACEIEAISFFEYYKAYLQKYGKWGWAKLLAVQATLSNLSQDIDDNTHPLAIELSVLLN